MHTDVCTYMYTDRHVYRHVYRHACIHVYRRHASRIDLHVGMPKAMCIDTGIGTCRGMRGATCLDPAYSHVHGHVYRVALGACDVILPELVQIARVVLHHSHLHGVRGNMCLYGCISAQAQLNVARSAVVASADGLAPTTTGISRRCRSQRSIHHAPSCFH